MKPQIQGRQFNKQDTFERILNASSQIFSYYGYKATPLGRVANHAQLSRTTIYDKFLSKAQLVTETLRMLDETIEEKLLSNAYHDEICYDRRLEDLVSSAKIFYKETRQCLFHRLGMEFAGQVNKFTRIIEDHKNKWREALLHLCIPIFGNEESLKQVNRIYEEIMRSAMASSYVPPLLSVNDFEKYSIQASTTTSDTH